MGWLVNPSLNLLLKLIALIVTALALSPARTTWTSPRRTDRTGIYDNRQKALNYRVVGSSREVGISRLPHRSEFE